MKVTKVGSRGYILTFDALLNTEFNCTTNVYLIDGEKSIFLCDTFLGPESMMLVKKFMDKYLISKPIIVFNSHSDWDHIWGNNFFKECPIIAHEKCRDNMLKVASYELEKYKNYAEGKVEIWLPNITFSDKMIFNDEGVIFMYSPGHTRDSASCIDIRDNILFAGDNVESPNPYLNDTNFEEYESTLNKYLNLGVKHIVPGHGEIADYDLVKRNLEYIKLIKKKHKKL